MLIWMKKTVFFFGLLLAFFTGAATASSISVNPMAVDLTFNTRFQDIQVQNTGKDTAYVAITIYRLNHPGETGQSFTELSDNPYQVGLIATPNKMVIPPGQMRIARILYIGNPVTSDAIYEVKFSPVSGELVSLANSNTNVQAGVELIIAYGVAVYVRPVTLNSTITAVRHGTSLTLTNTGNTSVLIGNCNQCTTAGKTSNCQPAGISQMLYPGNSKKFTLPQDLPVNCQKQVLQNQVSGFNIP